MGTLGRNINVGIIGCGSIAQAAHVPGYLQMPGVTVAAAADPGRKQRLAVESLAPGVRTYTNHEAMLAKESLDLVSVCTPNYLHAEHAIAAMRAGAHVLLEKPAALSMKEIAAIRKAQQAAEKLLVVGFSHRFMAGPRKAKALLEQGVIGEPYMIRVRFAHCGPYPGWAQGPWFYDPEQAGGGAMLDMGIHAIDLCNWLIGPVDSVAAQVGTLRKKIKVDDNAVMALNFANGRTLGYIEVGWTSPAGFSGLEIMGDDGCITINYANGMTVSTGRITPDQKASTRLKTRKLNLWPTKGGWQTEISDVVRAMRRGDDLNMGIDAGGEALAVALASYESAMTGKRTKVKAKP